MFRGMLYNTIINSFAFSASSNFFLKCFSKYRVHIFLSTGATSENRIEAIREESKVQHTKENIRYQKRTKKKKSGWLEEIVRNAEADHTRQCWFSTPVYCTNTKYFDYVRSTWAAKKTAAILRRKNLSFFVQVLSLFQHSLSALIYWQADSDIYSVLKGDNKTLIDVAGIDTWMRGHQPPIIRFRHGWYWQSSPNCLILWPSCNQHECWIKMTYSVVIETDSIHCRCLRHSESLAPIIFRDSGSDFRIKPY